MPVGAITNYIDVAQLVLYVFWFFFFALIFWIRTEDKREGYPAESLPAGQDDDDGGLPAAAEAEDLQDAAHREDQVESSPARRQAAVQAQRRADRGLPRRRAGPDR
jgi:hypothetical protein